MSKKIKSKKTSSNNRKQRLKKTEKVFTKSKKRVLSASKTPKTPLKKTKKTVKVQQLSNGQFAPGNTLGFQKGESGNKNGHPRHPEIQYLRDAMAAEGIKQKKTLYQHAVERAYVSDKVLIAILKKIIPDLKQIDLSELQEEIGRLILVMSPLIPTTKGNNA